MVNIRISNRNLMWILVITIAISVFGTVINLNIIKNNMVQSEITANFVGIVQLKIMGFVAMDVRNSEINFGSGPINFVTDLSTEQINPETFNECIEINDTYNHSYECRGLQIDNVGNTFINLTMSSDNDGDSLFLGDNITDEFRFAVAPGNLSGAPGSSCNINIRDDESLFPKDTNYINGFMNWTVVNKSLIYTICHNFSFWAPNNRLVIEVNVTIPADEGNYSPGQERIAYISFIGEDIE